MGQVCCNHEHKQSIFSGENKAPLSTDKRWLSAPYLGNLEDYRIDMRFNSASYCRQKRQLIVDYHKQILFYDLHDEPDDSVWSTNGPSIARKLC